MKTAIHPELIHTTITCQSCGTAIDAHTARPVSSVDVCSNCHPAYTGVPRTVSTGSRVERFERRRRAARAPIAA